MKKHILALTALALLSACSSTKSSNTTAGINPGTTATTAISEQRATSDFKRQGIRVHYTLTGNLEAIESTGYAPVWGNSENALRESYRVAELEAKKRMNDFIHKETITSAVSVKMISQNLEQAKDQKNNQFTSNRTGSSELIATDDIDDVANKSATVADNNTAARTDALKISSTVNTTITNNNQGILGGLYLKEGEVINNGRAVQVVMRWDARHQDIRLQVRGMMMQ